MRKRLISYGVFFAAIFLFVLSPFAVERSIGEAANANKKKVVIVRFKLPPDNFGSTIRLFREEMAAMGYKEGENIEYEELLTSTGDQSSIPEVEAFVEKHKDTADAFVTCGWLSMTVREKLKGTAIPQVAAIMAQPVAVKIMDGPLDKPSGSNVTAIYVMYPPEKTFALLKMVIPTAKKYGVVYNSKVPADQFSKKWYEETTAAQRLGVEIVYFDLSDGLEKVMEEIKKSGVDAYGGVLSFREPRFTPLLNMGMPIIGPKADTMDLEKIKPTDELIGHYNPFDIPGTQAARILHDVFNGKNIGEIVPQPVEEQMVFVNLDAAKRLRIDIPTKLLGSGYVIIR